MRTGTSIIACWLVSMLLFAPSMLFAENFKLVGQEKQIFLFERWIPAVKGEKVRELKAVFDIQSDIPTIVNMLKDERKSMKWNVNAAEFKILKSKDINQWTTYIKYDIPWPLNDQDCCLKYRYNGDEQKMVITFESTSSTYCPAKEGIDRITGARGKWILQKMPDSNIKVIYLITTDRSSKVPRWISDKIIHNNLYSTMAAFKDMAEKAA